MRRWRIRSRPWLVATFLVLMASTASAVVVKGRGELTAMGSGLAVLDMRGVLRARGAGVLIVDENVRVQVTGPGHKTYLGDGRVLYEGFGRVKVSSLRARTRIEIAGAGIGLRARGVGRALLKGHGIFRTDDGDGNWGPDQEVEFEPQVR